MHSVGQFAPDSIEEARERYEALGSTAQVVVKEVAKAMDFGDEEYDERVTGEVVETARDTLFSESLAVHVGTREEYQEWCDENGCDIAEFGSDNVDNVVWHAAPFAERAVAATFQNEEDAAVGTLRRQAYGRIYSDVL